MASSTQLTRKDQPKDPCLAAAETLSAIDFGQQGSVQIQQNISVNPAPAGLACPKCNFTFLVTDHNGYKRADIVRTPAEFRHWLFAAGLINSVASVPSIDGADNESNDHGQTAESKLAVSLEVMPYHERLVGLGPELMQPSDEEHSITMAKAASQAWIEALLPSVPSNVSAIYVSVTGSRSTWCRRGLQYELPRLLLRLRRRAANLSTQKVLVELTGWAMIAEWRTWRSSGEEIGREGEMEACGGEDPQRKTMGPWCWH